MGRVRRQGPGLIRLLLWIWRATSADPFSGRSVGAFNNLATLDPSSNTRSYSASAYATPASSRPNFRLITSASVNRILFDGAGSEMIASGVEAVIDGKVQRVVATSELILAAGTYQSPKQLELSGIGDSNLLGKYGIETVVVNPNVGRNLQDHLMTAISFELVDGIETLDGLMRQEPEALQAAQSQYQLDMSGPFSIGGVRSHSYLPLTEFASTEGKRKQKKLLDDFFQGNNERTAEQDIVQEMLEGDGDGSGAMFMWLGQNATHENEATAEHGPVLQPGSFASIGVMQTHPFSRGSSHLSSAEPSAKPSIDHQYLAQEADLEMLARHLLQIETVQQKRPLCDLFRSNGKRNHAKAYVKTLAEAKQYVRNTAKTAYHGCGTCAMRPRQKGGVVDKDLNVYGVGKLRVVDASVFPIIPRGNTQSTVYAVAEKAADLIKASR